MNVILIVLGALAVVSAVGVVASRRTIYSALSLVGTMVCLAVIFLLLNAQFLAMVQVIVYAGAVMVLFVFIIALLNPGAEDRWKIRDPRLLVGIIAAAYLVVQVIVLASSTLSYDHTTGEMRATQLSVQAVGVVPAELSYDQTSVNDAGNVQTVAGQLFTTFALPFEITSLLLMVAAIGAVYLTRKEEQT